MWVGIKGRLKSRGFWRSSVVGSAMIAMAATAVADAANDGFEERVRAYILANPEVILEALEILSERENRTNMAAKVAAYADIFARPARLGIGPKDAELRVVEFFDYRCAPCKALHPKLIAALNAHPDIRVEMHHLPILSPGSERGARFALAAGNVSGSDAYAAVHNDLWALKGPLRAAAFERIAAKHGLDWPAIQSEMNSDTVSARIARNRDMAIDLEILGTPAFVTPTSVSFGQSDAAALVADWLNQ